ncbi:MAG: hypothetical protein E7Z87_03890 [Cyanobacteria bacterium SIG26]|nr:hypothetical protein [Cyanobacteria bacterium SIG26]
MRKKQIAIAIILSLSAFALTTIYANATEPAVTFLEENQTPQRPQTFIPLNLNPNEVVFKANSTRIHAIDPILGANFFPGGRGANKMVIYTKDFGLHTGTNEFGTEAIVEGNTVIALSGADSTIPDNGVVISGHGIAKNWISQNITVGSKVYIDEENNILNIYTTSESYTYEAREKIKEALSIIDFYKTTTSNYDWQKPMQHIQTAENYINIAEHETKNSTILQQYTKEAIDSANQALKTSLPYIKTELKGTWLRPTETSREQIIETLEKIQSSGFNSIFLETYFHGNTIFPSKTMNKYGFTVQNPIFEGFDPLEVWIKEAHKRDIKVHIWFQSFYVGNKPPENCASSILSVRPDWGNKTKQYANEPTATRSISEHNGYFIDPANPEIHEFLLELVSEIIENYNPDGINLDYIRYPNNNTDKAEAAWGFTDYARNEFKTQYGIDPVDLTTADVQWFDWNQYRRDNITKFVKKVGELCKKEKVYLSAVIFPDIASALSSKQQDWRTWSINGYINGFTPLFLTYDQSMLASMMHDVISVKAPTTELYAGLFVTFMGGAPEDLVRQIYQTRRMFANGVILFDYAHTTPLYTTTLMAGAFNENKKIKLTETNKKRKWFKRNEEKQSQQPTKRIQTNSKNKGTWVFSK